MKKTVSRAAYAIAALCVLLCSAWRAQAQTTLSPGDIIFVGYNSAGATDDDFSFILLTNVSAGTTISFTDFGWRTDAPAFQSANPCGANTGALSDGAITWTATSALPCGTQVSILCRTALTANTGIVTGLQATGANASEYISLATGGESIFAFQGTLSTPSLLAALNMNGAWDATVLNCTFSSAISALPAVLASHNLVITPERDNARYNCTITAQSPANLRTAILNNSNWLSSDGAANVFTLPLSCTFSCSPNVTPSFTNGSPQSLSVCQNASATSINNLLTVAEPNSGQSMTWSVASAPSNGTLGGFNATTTSTGSNLTPTGLTYTPNSNYSGSDAFTIQISDGFSSATTTINVTVNPIPTVNTISNQTVSNGASTTAINFTGSVPGTIYSWTNNNTSIGLAASGTGDIASFTATNGGSSPVVATITVVPSNAGCTGSSSTFTITVNPTLPPTSLLAGDIAFVGYNSAGSTDDNFSFILLTDITAGTTISFTDFGWRTDAPAFQSANPCGPSTGATTDGAITWTASSALPCGTEISILCRTALTASTGTVTGLQATATNASEYMNLGTGGESIFAFQGTLGSPTLITGLNMNGGWDATVLNCTFSSAVSALPAALASFSLVKTPETDNARYNCSTTAQSPANLRAAIFDNTNWTGSDGGANVFTLPLGCPFSCNANPAPAFVGGPSQSLSVCQNSSATSINNLLTVVEPNVGQTMTWSVVSSPSNGTLGGFNATTTSTGSNLTPTGLTYTPNSGYSGPDVFTVQISDGTATATTTINVTVNPIPDVDPVSNQTLSSGASTTAVNFTGTVSGGTYNWTNSAPSIGLAASGTGNIPSFIATNSGVSPVVATITVTPSIAGCTGTSTSFTITVNPIPVQPPASLSAGDIVFVGYNSAGLTDDEFSFILLTDITAGTTISFTDFGWRTDAPAFQSANPCGPTTGASTDGAITWTAASPLTCGTEVRITCRTALSASTGTVTGLQATAVNASEYMNLGTGGESIFAFQGSISSPSLLAALNMNGGWDATVLECTFNSAISALPAALASYNLVKIPETDNARYDCSVTSQSPANLRAAILDNANWTGTDGGTNVFTLPLGCPFGCNTNTAPAFAGGASQSLSVCQDAAATSINSLLTVAEPNAGQTMTWSIVSAPSNGTLGGFNATTTSTGSNLTPTGLTYTPATGYSGVDAFTIEISDGIATATTTINVTTNPTPNVNPVPNQTVCNGAATTAINFSGTVPGTTYNWTSDNTSIGLSASGTGDISSFTATNSGTTPVVATITVSPSAAGCVGSSTSFTITVNPTPVVNAVPDQAICAGAATAAVNFSNAVSGTTYSWTNDNTSIGLPATGTGDISSFIATNSNAGAISGTITVTPTANACTGAAESFTITVNALPTVSAVASPVSCNGGTDGTVTVSATGGASPYTGTGTFTGLSAGTYSYTVTDANGCSSSTSATVTEPTALVASNTTTPVSCNGGSDGTVTVSATGGTAPYTGTGTFTGLTAGTYTYTITDANGCTTTTTATVSEPTALVASNTTTPVSCNGGSDGTVTVSVTGGTAPYAGTGSFTGLSAGTYTYTVTDANGCTTTTTATVSQPTALIASNTTTPVSCNGGSDGTVTVSATGGTAPYAGTGSFTGLSAGTYNYTVTDANGCTTTTTATVSQPTALAASNTTTPVSCNGGNDGTVTVSATGGTAPYTGTGTFTGLSAGTYTYTVTDANGCTTITTATVSQPTALAASNTTTPVSCNGGNTGTVTVSATGGTAPYAGTGSFTGLSAGTYTYTVTDANGCTATTTATVGQSTTLSVNINVSPVNTIPGQAPYTIFLGYGPQSVTLSATVSGGTPGYTYSWSPTTGVANPTNASTSVSPTGTTNYTVTVTDANGCVKTATRTINVVDLRCCPGSNPNCNKVKVCHHDRNTLCININAVPAHLGHGDMLGECPSNKPGIFEEPGEETPGKITGASAGIVKAYPNPNNGSFFVQIPAGWSNAEVAITDIAGRIVETKTITANDGTPVLFNMANAAPGIYFIKVNAGDNSTVTKMIVQ